MNPFGRNNICNIVPNKTTTVERKKEINPEATKEEIRQAARMAQAEEFILGMKNGYNSVLGQGGVNLSGGQKQRISIARALVKKNLPF